MFFSEIAGRSGLFVDGDWVEKKDQDYNGSVRLIQLADVGAGRFLDKSYKHLTSSKAKELNCTYLHKGDILIARLGEPLCKACIFPYDGHYITAVDIAILRIGIKEVNSNYLVYLINSPWFKEQIKPYESGTTRKRISRKNLNRIDITLPPFGVQNTIVKQIEESLSQLDSAVATLNKTKQQLEIYRQAVMKEAFENIGSYTDLSKVATMIDPQPSHRTPPETSGGVPYIGIGDIDYENRTINFSDSRKVSQAVLLEHKDRYILREGDFIMGKIGTIGKPFRLPLPQNYSLSANVILIQPNSEIIYPEYLYWQFSSHWITKQLMKGANATSQPAFGIKKARVLSIKMCSIEEQMLVVEMINNRLSIFDKIEQTVNQSLQQAEVLRQNILKQAFWGESN